MQVSQQFQKHVPVVPVERVSVPVQRISEDQVAGGGVRYHQFAQLQQASTDSDYFSSDQEHRSQVSYGSQGFESRQLFPMQRKQNSDELLGSMNQGRFIGHGGASAPSTSHESSRKNSSTANTRTGSGTANTSVTSSPKGLALGQKTFSQIPATSSQAFDYSQPVQVGPPISNLMILKPPLGPLVQRDQANPDQIQKRDNPVTPFKNSKWHDPRSIQNKQNILKSIEDKKFFEDLHSIQNLKKSEAPKAKKKTTAKKKKMKAEDEGSLKNLSQRGCWSFGSVKSYILGDLDLSSDDADLHSFEISSNSSQAKSIGDDMLQPAHHNKSAKVVHEDQEIDDGYLRDEDFKGFIAKQSPFSFKNPIFFSCPNNKVPSKRRPINPQNLQSRKQLFAPDPQVSTFSVNQPEGQGMVNDQSQHINLRQTPIERLQSQICQIRQLPSAMPHGDQPLSNTIMHFNNQQILKQSIIQMHNIQSQHNQPQPQLRMQ